MVMLSLSGQAGQTAVFKCHAVRCGVVLWSADAIASGLCRFAASPSRGWFRKETFQLIWVFERKTVRHVVGHGRSVQIRKW